MSQEPHDPFIESWTRNGFAGDYSVVVRPSGSYDFDSVNGPHAPHRLDVHDVAEADAKSLGLSIPILESNNGAAIAILVRSQPTAYALRNVEQDELHFIQDGSMDFITDVGTLHADAGDFVCIPRAVGYRLEPSGGVTDVVIQMPEPCLLSPPTPFSMFDPITHVCRADPTKPSKDGPRRMVIKAFDGVTTFETPHDPVAIESHLGGSIPVWKINLRDVSPVCYWPHGRSPEFFVKSESSDLLLYPLSARPSSRPPLHINADYDEINYYFGGGDVYGDVRDPGTLTWVPKGVTHWGPSEDTNGHLNWLLESRHTMRLTPYGEQIAALMDTSNYGFHRSETRLVASRTQTQKEATVNA